jgi:hypothetical protein
LTRSIEAFSATVSSILTPVKVFTEIEKGGFGRLYGLLHACISEVPKNARTGPTSDNHV